MSALFGGAAALMLTSLGAGKDKAKFATSLFELLTRQFPTLSVKARVLIIAHAAYESGWGLLSNARAQSNNIFNITAGPAWSGLTAQGTDTDGAGKSIAQRWRVYPSLDAAVKDYWLFLGGSRYLSARTELVNQADPTQFATLLRAGGYFTAPLSSYASTLTNLRNEVARILKVTV